LGRADAIGGSSEDDMKTLRALMLAFALTLAALAGTTGVWWTMAFPVPHVLAWVYLKDGE